MMQSRSLKSGKLVLVASPSLVRGAVHTRQRNSCAPIEPNCATTEVPQKRPVTKPMCVYISGSNSLHFTSPILHKVEAVYLPKSRE